MSEQVPAIAVAVLVVGDRYALQHRDDIPDIAWPGHWGLFGGIVEPGETSTVAVIREIEEEIGLTVPGVRLMWENERYINAQGLLRHLSVFQADVTEIWPAHRLGEGQGAGVFAADQLPAPIVPLARAMIERHRALR